MKIELKRQRILDFDVEARPLSWYGGDFVTKEITGVAWKFIGERAPCEVRLLGFKCLHPVDGEFCGEYHLGVDPRVMLGDFVEAYNAADIVTGHFIRGYDLPVINGGLLELGMKPLEPKLSQDTKLDFVKRSGISTSQENLGAMFELKHPKIQMDQGKWRAANRLSPEGVERTRRRVVGDVRQHIEMRRKMLELDLLGAPRRWSSKSSGVGRYHA